ncbi:MAG: HAD family hydrolase [Plectolyngbya sp. WJT66-NPBG17]|nr:HAD family hydrolase [Plectolyngbya sp. WJT66-NPBG17]
MTQFDLVIFDCDGVLVDSEPIVNRIFAETLTEAGFPITYAEVTQQFKGKSTATCLEIIKKVYGKPLPLDLLERNREREIAALHQELQPIAGIAEALAQITLPKCVASNSSHRHIQLVLGLTGLLHQFEGKLHSCHDVDRPKPFPDVYLYAAQQMGKNPDRCVVIEDSVPGVQAGYAAGMTVFGYVQQRDYPEEEAASERDALLADGARIVFNDMRQLAELLSC